MAGYTMQQALNKLVDLLSGGAGGSATTTVKDGSSSNLMKVNADGSIDVNAEVQVGDVEIGAVEIKDATTNTRAVVNSNNQLEVAVTPGTISLDKDESDTALTTSPQAFTPSGTVYNMVLVNDELVTGTDIYWGTTSGNCHFVLKPGYSISIERKTITSIYLKGASGGEKYQLHMWE